MTTHLDFLLTSIKHNLINHLLDDFNDKIERLQLAINSIKDSRDSNTKSSAGDKYETGRAMAQIELDNVERQLQQTLHLKNDLLKIDVSKPYTQVDYGALVQTQAGYYLLAIGLGIVKVGNQPFYCISSSSPIGKALLGKHPGDIFTFRDTQFTIIAIN